MTYNAIWDRAWFPQTNNPRFISVSEALNLRDAGTLKTGDLFCCNGQCQVRLGPRKSFLRRTNRGYTKVRGCFRRLPGARREKIERICSTHKKSQQQGETWKHARVLSEITNYLLNSEKFNVASVERLEGLSSSNESNDEADLLISHHKEIIGASKEIRLICRFQNMRRANRVIKRHYPNIIFVDMHRWRDSDIDFIDYIHQIVDSQYERLANPKTMSKSDLIHKITYVYPNLGFQNGGGLGYGNKGIISFEEDTDSRVFDIIHNRYSQLLKAVEEHNYWSINEPGKNRYHLRNLDFGNYGGFFNLRPGIIDNETEDLFPKSISIMIQENFYNHMMNRTAMGQVLSGVEDDIVPISLALLEGDGQKGFNDLPIGLSESQFITGWSEKESPFNDNGLDLLAKFMDKIVELCNVERIRESEKNTWDFTWNRYEDLYTYNSISKKIPTFEEIREIDGGFVQWWYHLAIPDLLFWNYFDDGQKEVVFQKVKRFYRKISVFMGRIVVMPLLELELDKLPKTIHDKNKIFTELSHIYEDEEFQFGKPLSVKDYFFLKWVLLADRFYPQVNAPIIKDIVHACKYSTDELTTQVNFELPLSVQRILNDSENLSEAIIDKLLSTRNSEEE